MNKFTKEELVNEAGSYFDMYPSKNKLFATDDGNFFLEKNPAQDHATKSQSPLFTFDRVETPASDPPAGDPPAGDPPTGDPPAGDPPAGDPPAGDPPASGPAVDPVADAEALKKQLLEVDVPTLDYTDARALLGALNLVAESGKKADILASLAAYKAELMLASASLPE